MNKKGHGERTFLMTNCIKRKHRIYKFKFPELNWFAFTRFLLNFIKIEHGFTVYIGNVRTLVPVPEPVEAAFYVSIEKKQKLGKPPWRVHYVLVFALLIHTYGGCCRKGNTQPGMGEPSSRSKGNI
ncbi:hypothetical protein ACOSQ3_030595 [Xanthoceras sorbifolium]